MGFPTPTRAWGNPTQPRGHHACPSCASQVWWEPGYAYPLNVVRDRVAGPHTAAICRERRTRNRVA